MSEKLDELPLISLSSSVLSNFTDACEIFQNVSAVHECSANLAETHGFSQKFYLNSSIEATRRSSVIITLLKVTFPGTFLEYSKVQRTFLEFSFLQFFAEDK